MAGPLLTLAAIMLATGAITPAVAEKVSCGLIRDHDLKRQCYAERDRKPSECGTISDSDARRMCRLRAGDR